MKLGNRLVKELVNQPEKCIEHKFDFLFVCFQSSSAHSYNHVAELLVFLPFLSQKKYPNFKIIHKSIPDPITKIDTTYFVRSRRHQSQCSCIHKLVLHLWKCKFHHFDTDHDVDKHQLSKLEHPAKNLKCKYYSKVCK